MASPTDVLVALQDMVVAVNKLADQVSTSFAQITVTTTPPSGGTITFTSSLASGFLSVTTSSGGSYKVPVYL